MKPYFPQNTLVEIKLFITRGLFSQKEKQEGFKFYGISTNSVTNQFIWQQMMIGHAIPFYRTLFIDLSYKTFTHTVCNIKTTTDGYCSIQQL